MKHVRKLAIAIATVAAAAAISVGWTGQADARIYVGPRYGVVYHPGPSVPWYAVRAYYFGGPWTGPYYSWAGWTDYAARNGIACVPGTIVKGGDGIWYNCQ